jgi:hypothetical protein
VARNSSQSSANIPSSLSVATAAGWKCSDISARFAVRVLLIACSSWAQIRSWRGDAVDGLPDTLVSKD